MSLPVWVTVAASALSAGAAAAVTAVYLGRRGKRFERERERAREEEGLAFLGTVVTGLAHEVRNPLSTLRMHLQLLEEEWADPITERERRGHKRIGDLLRETKRIEDVLNSFLRFAGRRELSIESVPLAAMLRELLAFLAPRIEEGGLRIDLRVPEDLPSVPADPGLLRQAFLNVLLNACEASPRGGLIEVRAQAARKGLVDVSIRDHGGGIPAPHRDRIFEVYFSTKPGGTGLGLPVARQIVERHGGAIRAESPPDGGALFAISLPTERPA